MAPTYAKFSNKEKVDMRRINGQLSCAECRRLKLKCDKKIPCESCVRRGCHSICPTGTLANGTGKKLVVADTGDLHRTVDKMGDRIRELEEAIQKFQSVVSKDPHPLLRPEFLNIKFPPGLAIPTDAQDEVPTLELADALGSLTINANGSTKYFGSTAGTETLFMAGAEANDYPQLLDEEKLSPAFKNIPGLQKSFPVKPSRDWDHPKCLSMMYSYLPPKPRAWTLCEIFFQHGPWSGQMITREELVDEMLVPAYKHLAAHSGDPDQESPIPHNKLASLFLVFGLGTLLDLTLPPYSPEADWYFDLSVATLNLHDPFIPAVATVQALLMMAIFLNHGGRRFTMEGSWMLVSWASKMGQSIGLHQERSHRVLLPTESDRRRRLFWDIYTFDLSLCIKLGRPPSIRLSYVDLQLPVDNEQSLDDQGNIVPGYHWLKWNFVLNVLSKVVEVTLNAHPPPYRAILDLDRLIREGRVYKKYFNKKSWENSPLPTKQMRPFFLRQHRSIVGIYVHRSYFAQAVLSHPSDPLLSPYAASYLAAYRCASGLISLKTKYFSKFPELVERWWSLWSSSLSAALIVGTVALHTPDAHLAARAFAELCVVVDLFEKGSGSSSRAKHGLDMLHRMRDRALVRFSQQDARKVVNYSAKPRIDTSDFDDELEMFGGQTKLLVSKILAQQATTKKAPPQTPPPPTPIQNQQSLIDFFVPQMGPDWVIPGPDDTLPIPQLAYDYGNDPNASIFDGGLLSEDSNLSGTTNVPLLDTEMPGLMGMATEDEFMNMLNDFSTETQTHQVQDTMWQQMQDAFETDEPGMGVMGQSMHDAMREQTYAMTGEQRAAPSRGRYPTMDSESAGVIFRGF